MLSGFEALRPEDAVRTRTFIFGGKPRWGIPPGVQWVINGESFDPTRVDADPHLGDTEIWRFVNRAFLGRTMLHPVHTHLAPFQVLRRNGRFPLPQERGWKDTIAIDDGEDVDVILRWTGSRKQALINSDLDHLLRRAERKPNTRGVRRVQNAKPVLPGRDFQHGPRRSIDEHDRTGCTAVPVVLVIEFTVAREGAILQDERDVEFIPRQLFVHGCAVLEQIQSGETHVEVAACQSPTVIVIPEGAGAAQVVVLVAAAVTRADRVRRKPIRLRPGDTSVKMHDRGHGEAVGVRHEYG